MGEADGIVRPDVKRPRSTNTGTPGRTIASNGYVLVRAPGHHLADVRGYAYEHRLVAERMLGRPLRAGEQIHHRNGIKTDNRPDNLEVCASRLHHGERHRVRGVGRRRHAEANPEVACECGCGARFARFDAGGRPRRFLPGHNSRVRLGGCAARSAGEVGDV